VKLFGCLNIPALPGLLLLLIGTTFAAEPPGRVSPGTGPRHAIAMHGEPLYRQDIENFPYVNPNAPKGGKFVVGDIGSFDSLNPFIIRGTTPSITLDVTRFVVQHHTFESLMTRGQDEPFSLYGRIAETIETPEDRSWVEFRLREGVRFSDGSPLTAQDVLFSWQTLRDKGRPNMRRYYGFVSEAKTIDERTIRFTFDDTGNRELPLIMGLMPILSKAYYSTHDITKTSLEAPLGSGPYMVASVDAGRRITFKRDPDYWAADLAVTRGHYNFDLIQYEYFRDSTSLFEAFKRGEITFRAERSAKTWMTGYDFNAVKTGDVVKTEIAHGRPAAMYGFVFNTRREIFADIKVRQALTLLFDFEWMNEYLFFGAFKRLQSFFDNSELSSHGRPANDLERDYLASSENAVTSDIFERGWTAPIGGSLANNRRNTFTALGLLEEAGWRIDHGRLVNAKTKLPFAFEIMIMEPREERIALHYARSLEDLGITANVRVVDSAQFQQRRQTYDFHMVPFAWAGTLSPGNEQAFRYGSAEADIEGTFNLAGIKSAAVDGLIIRLTDARSRQELIAAARALDRVLLSGSYVIPFYYPPSDWLAYRSYLRRPAQQALTGVKLETWWIDPNPANN